MYQTLFDLSVDGLGQFVPGHMLEVDGIDLLHEPFHTGIEQPAREIDIEAPEELRINHTDRIKLKHLHIGQFCPGFEPEDIAVPCRLVWVGGHRIELTTSPCGQNHRLRLNHLDFSPGNIPAHRPSDLVLLNQQPDGQDIRNHLDPSPHRLSSKGIDDHFATGLFVGQGSRITVACRLAPWEKTFPGSLSLKKHAHPLQLFNR